MYPTAMRAIVAALLAFVTLAAMPALAQDGEKMVQVDPEAWRAFLVELRAEAAADGIREDILSEALDGLQPIRRVIQLDRAQPEFTITFQQYLDRVVPQFRIDRARTKRAENRELLDSVEDKIGVPSHFIVALWGIETDFGRITGGFKVIRALATLAFDDRRAKFFRRELLAALQILNEGHIAPADMVGSWAGAMGQAQLMPTSFVAYSVDFDGDGRRDVWNSKADVFGSAANFLKTEGWLTDETWGFEVRLPDGLDAETWASKVELLGLKVKKPVAEWQALGLRLEGGGDLPDPGYEVSVLHPDQGAERAFLIFENFRNILKWNRSNNFALAVGLLADAIEAP
jgi:membrane-bound lytic murein transglycosylase B